MAKIPQTTAGKQASTPQNFRRPNFNVLHAQPLPLKVHPLPPLIPHNPLSVLYLVFTYFRQVVLQPSSHSKTKYYGHFSPETYSVHVTDDVALRVFWERGFFGKGSLSRSEPTWLNRERRRRGLLVGDTSEDVTRKRREERKVFKKERARKLQEDIQKRLKEEATPGVRSANQREDSAEVLASPTSIDSDEKHLDEPSLVNVDEQQVEPTSGVIPEGVKGQELNTAVMEAEEVEITNEEHLQLDPCEAFFLQYALGVLTVLSSKSDEPIPTSQLFGLFASRATFPPTPSLLLPDPDNKFILSYVAYHHFRSLGWVVRPGMKFSVDLLLYNRGPVFSHAEFAVTIVPAYSHSYWHKEGKAHVEAKGKSKPWHWVHMVNRVQSQVKKTLVLCFIEVPPPWGGDTWNGELKDIESLFKSYEVREMVLRRWVPNRSRD